MFDAATGQLAFPEITLGPETRLEDLKTCYGGKLFVGDMGTGWRMVRLPVRKVDGVQWGVILYFEGPALKSIDLANFDVDAAQQPAWHDAWVTAHAGDTAKTFPWGVIASDFDHKNGEHSITIRYNSTALPLSWPWKGLFAVLLASAAVWGGLRWIGGFTFEQMRSGTAGPAARYFALYILVAGTAAIVYGLVDMSREAARRIRGLAARPGRTSPTSSAPR